MYKISDVMNRSEFSNILTYLKYDAIGENEALIESYDCAIGESCETSRVILIEEQEEKLSSFVECDGI